MQLVPTTTTPPLMKPPALAKALGIHPDTFRRVAKTPGFPAPLNVGPRTKLYNLEEVTTWLRDTPPAHPTTTTSGGPRRPVTDRDPMEALRSLMTA